VSVSNKTENNKDQTYVDHLQAAF